MQNTTIQAPRPNTGKLRPFSHTEQSSRSVTRTLIALLLGAILASLTVAAPAQARDGDSAPGAMPEAVGAYR